MIIVIKAAMAIDHGETIFKIFSNRPYVVLKWTGTRQFNNEKHNPIRQKWL